MTAPKPELRPFDIKAALLAGGFLYVAGFGFLGHYWYELTGTGIGFLIFIWAGVTFLLAGLWFAGATRALRSKGVVTALLSGIAIFGGAYAVNLLGFRGLALPGFSFFVAYTGTAGLIACLALGRNPARSSAAPQTEGGNAGILVIQAFAFWLLCLGLHAIMLNALPWFRENLVPLVVCLGIILSLNIVVIIWAFSRLWRAGDTTRRMLALLFAAPLATDIIGAAYLYSTGATLYQIMGNIPPN